MAAFSLATGLRESNVTHIKWQQVNLDKKHALVHADESKTKRAIPVPGFYVTNKRYVLDLYGAPGEIRTPDPLVRSQILYPTELRAQA